MSLWTTVQVPHQIVQDMASILPDDIDKKATQMFGEIPSEMNFDQ